jgi:predicted dehydrogenase
MAAQSPIRLAIIGCGAVARSSHLKALASLPQYEVRYLCDRNPRAAETAKQMFGLRGAKVTPQVADLGGNVDAAVVCVWPSFHMPVTCELLDMGIDVLCEKPLATTAAAATEIASAARRTQRIVAVGQWCRCQKNAWILKKLLSLGLLGEIREVIAEFGAELSWPMSGDAYYDRKLTSGGVMYDMGIHVLDLLVWLFGDVSGISYRDDSYGGVETNGILIGELRIAGRKVPCRVSASWTHRLMNGIRVVGSDGEVEALFAERDQVSIRRSLGNERIEFHVGPRGIEMPFGSSSPPEALLEDFATSVRTRRVPITVAESAIAPLRIIEEAYAARKPIAQPWVETWPETACSIRAS